MSVDRTAVIQGLLSGVLVAGAAGGVVAWEASRAPSPMTLSVLAAAAGLSMAGGLAVGLARGSREAKLARTLRGYAERRAAGEPATPPPLPKVWARVAEAFNAGMNQLGEQVQTLTSQRRELQLEARVNEAERRHLEAILNAISDGVIVTDGFDEVVLANGAAARALNFALEPALRRHFDEVVQDARLVKLVRETRAGAAAGRRSLEHRIDHQGATEHFQITATRVADGGAAEGVVTVLRNVTKDREIAEMKSDFVSKVSHELRTPLSSIKAYIEMLIDGEAHDEQTRSEFYDIVQSETDRLQRLIDNILSISRIESGVTKVHRDHMVLPAMIQECVEVLVPQAREKQIELTYKPPPVMCEVYADRDMIYQAAMNLLSNAIKYTPAGGKVAVSLEVDEHDKQVVFAVADTGAGIPAEDLPRLFQKFFRVQSNNKLAKGTGLGLNLVEHVVEAIHEGRVWVESEVGKGSTFRFALPIAGDR